MDYHHDETHPISFIQVLIGGILFIILLRILTGVMWLLIFWAEPHFGTFYEAVVRVIPFPILVILIPLVLALLIILYVSRSRPKRPKSGHFENEEISEFETMRKLFKPSYSKEDIFMILKIILLIWFVIFVFQFVIWFAFRSYTPPSISFP